MTDSNNKKLIYKEMQFYDFNQWEHNVDYNHLYESWFLDKIFIHGINKIK